MQSVDIKANNSKLNTKAISQKVKNPKRKAVHITRLKKFLKFHIISQKQPIRPIKNIC